MLRNNLMLPTEALDIPEAIDFDGTNDYLSRSSDLVGNADGKTFTFSAWVWPTTTATASLLYYVATSVGNARVNIYYDYGYAVMVLKDSSGTTVLDVSFTLQKPIQTFSHILVSIDLTNTANRYVYINDQNVTSSATWTTYTNSNINWANAYHTVGGRSVSNAKGRLSNVFLDYTYRDLSIEANRRLFITADRKPAANQAALNPILYLPLNDPTQPGKNLGTGGDFNLTGVVARSGRGPNQFNAPYSDLDGSADYLSRTSLTGIADGKAFTWCGSFNADTDLGVITAFQPASGEGFRILLLSGNFSVKASNASGLEILSANITLPYSANRNFTVVVSVDLSDSSKRFAYVNGVPASVTWSPYTNDIIQFSASTNYYIGRQVAGNYFNGRLGNVFFDTRYIDLSVPDNLAKFVTGTGIDAKPVDIGANGELPFGTAPLIYLPMYGNNAGKNYGTGGDFTVNSGPFTGARGPNEFWGNKADFVPNAYLSVNTNLSLVKSFSASFYVVFDDTGTVRVVFSSCGTSVLNPSIQIGRNGTTNKLHISCRSASGATVLYADSNSTFSAGTYYIQLCIDLSDTSKRKIFSNGVEVAVTYSYYSNTAIAPTSFVTVGCYCSNSGGSLSYYLDGKLSEFYFTTEYIDFSQEANRLKFRDAFGNPVALQPQIEAGTLPNPAIYMRFPPDNFGKNYGTGGDFTVNGIITDGGQL